MSITSPIVYHIFSYLKVLKSVNLNFLFKEAINNLFIPTYEILFIVHESNLSPFIYEQFIGSNIVESPTELVINKYILLNCAYLSFNYYLYIFYCFNISSSLVN